MKKKEIFLSIVLLFLIVSCSTTPMYNKKYIKNATYENDFYTAVNGEWLLENKGKQYYTVSSMVADNIEKNFIKVLDELVTKANKNRKEKMLVDYYMSGINIEERNKQGYEPIRKYIENFKKAENIEELVDYVFESFTETGISSLFSFDTNYYAEFNCLKPFFNDFLQNKKSIQEYKNFLETILILTDFNKEKAKKMAEMVIELEKTLSKKNLTLEETKFQEVTYDFYTIKKMFKEIDIEKSYRKQNLALIGSLYIKDFELVKESAKYFTNDNLELLKSYTICRFIANSCCFLSEDFYRAYLKLYGNENMLNEKDFFKRQTIYRMQQSFPSYLEDLFIENFCSKEMKSNVLELSKTIVETYKKIIIDTKLLNEKGKNIALKKLENITMNIAYPEKIIDFYEKIENLNSCTYLYNYGLTKTVKYNWIMTNRKYYYDTKGVLTLPVFDVMAHYENQTNAFTIFGGYLQEPSYSDDYTYEQVLGTIGSVIGHEISHGFDKERIVSTQHGFYVSIWDKESYENYNAWSENIVELYDGYPDFYGVKNNGLSTLNENIADILGMQVCLEVLKTKENPNYKEFFESYAFRRKSVLSKNNLIFYVNHDEHATPRARVNRVVSNFQEFYDTYGITKKDAMYIPIEKRVKF